MLGGKLLGWGFPVKWRRTCFGQIVRGDKALNKVGASLHAGALARTFRCVKVRLPSGDFIYFRR